MEKLKKVSSNDERIFYYTMVPASGGNIFIVGFEIRIYEIENCELKLIDLINFQIGENHVSKINECIKKNKGIVQSKLIRL